MAGGRSLHSPKGMAVVDELKNVTIEGELEAVVACASDWRIGRLSIASCDCPRIFVEGQTAAGNYDSVVKNSMN